MLHARHAGNRGFRSMLTGAASRRRWSAPLLLSSAVGFAGLSAARWNASCDTGRHVPLTSMWTAPAAGHPPRARVVLVHGLDSWRGTWRPTQEELSARGIGSLAVDLRGHGESDLGAEEDFSPAQLAADVREAVRSKGLSGEKFVLVGHSMGGRIAMRYAADYPQDLEAVVIEDMDCVQRTAKWADLTESQVQERRTFSRQFSTLAACREELAERYGYGTDRFAGWLRDGRVFPIQGTEGAYWSAINPMAQHLAMKTVLSTSDGFEAMQKLASDRACDVASFPIHVLVAGPEGTVCSWDALPGGVHDMSSQVPGLEVTEFKRASHSIHNTDRTRFVEHLEPLVPVVTRGSKL